MDDIFGFLGYLALILIYAWVAGTALWAVFVLPRIHKRQLEMLRRLNAIEARLNDSQNSRVLE
jgi:hypothetical protein